MKQKDYLLLSGWLYAGIVVAGLIFFAFQGSQTDRFGLVFGFCLLLFFSYKSYTCFRDSRVVRQEDMVYAPPTDANVAEQVSYYKRFLVFSAVVFPVASVLIWFDLNNLESGDVDSVSIWEPVAFLYNKCGYWVAVIAVPILGLIVCGLFLKKIMDLKG